MKLTIFGGTGEAGRQLIEQALVEGNEVVVFARNPSKFTIDHENLTIVQGELHNLVNIERAVNGIDAVISLLGPRPGEDSKSKPLTQGTQNIITAMKKFGVLRVGYLGRDEVGVQLSRADMASFILDELKSGKHIRQMPAISN